MSRQRERPNIGQVLRTVATVVKDVGLTGLGFWIIYHQEATGEVHGELLVVATVLLGVPTATNVLLAYLGRGTSAAATTSASAPSAERSP